MSPHWWRGNDALALQELETGYRYQYLVGERLRLAGLSVGLPELEIAETAEEALAFAQERDLTVNGHVLEVKSRALYFTSPSDFPFETAIVDTVRGWDQKQPEPLAVVMVSQSTEAMVVLPVRRSRSAWTTAILRDRVRDLTDTFYLAPRSSLVPFSSLVRFLQT